MTDKNFSITKLAHKLEALRKQGKRIVLSHGVFDLLHIGHIRYLRQAKACGDILVVTVTPDRFVDKGPGRPAFNEQLRLEAIAALDCVDYVALNEWSTAEETLHILRPHTYTKGAEFKNVQDAKIAKEAAVVESIGGTLTFIEDIVFSSSNLINRYLSNLSDETQEYLNQFRQQYSLSQVLTALNDLSDLRVLVVGDAILDEYVYCSALGASSKDPVLALRFQNQECFAGGALAVANHVAQHTSQVTLVTILGDDGKTPFIREHLAPSIDFHPLVRENTPTLTKQRILDVGSFQKLIEVYTMESSPLSDEFEEKLFETLVPLLADCDCVIAADFGHGCISLRIAEYLSTKAPFLAVNTQANAGNRGYHTVSRYPHADFVSLAGHEITLEYRNKAMSTSDMMLDLQKRLNCPTVLITEGRKGCAVLGTDFVRAPSFASTVVDRVGAGDALFSITALAAKKGFPLDLIAFLGNIVGSLAVETIGNAKAVGKDAIEKYITAIMK